MTEEQANALRGDLHELARRISPRMDWQSVEIGVLAGRVDRSSAEVGVLASRVDRPSADLRDFRRHVGERRDNLRNRGVGVVVTTVIIVVAVGSTCATSFNQVLSKLG